MYASRTHQPSLTRGMNDLADYEKPIYEQFTNKEFVDQLMAFLALEEANSSSSFHSDYFVLFKVRYGLNS